MNAEMASDMIVSKQKASGRATTHERYIHALTPAESAPTVFAGRASVYALSRNSGEVLRLYLADPSEGSKCESMRRSLKPPKPKRS